MKKESSDPSSVRQGFRVPFLGIVPGRLLPAYAMFAAFFTYFCMYAFRKSFTVGMFQDEFWMGMDMKIALIIFQVLGYMTSKFIGIRVISEMGSNKRFTGLILLIGLAELALFFFAILPPFWKPFALFFNGLPLGMIWGIVFSYLEGRRVSDMLGAGLCASFIISSGAVKTAGKWVMIAFGSTEYWMPVVIGALFFPLLVLFGWWLNHIPPPDKEDIAQRHERMPMSGKDRQRLVSVLSIGLIFLVLFYMLLTAFRDFRDNFAVELWTAMGYGGAPEVFTLAEIPIAILVLIMLGLTMYITRDRKALMIYHVIIASSLFLLLAATWCYQAHFIGPAFWMILVGIGLYVAYVPFNSILFDRMLASFRFKGNAGFLIYIADAFGYLGSVGILLYKNFGQANMSWLDFFLAACYILTLFGIVMIIGSYLFFRQKFTVYPE